MTFQNVETRRRENKEYVAKALSFKFLIIDVQKLLSFCIEKTEGPAKPVNGYINRSSKRVLKN